VFKKETCGPVLSLFLLSLGGFLIHLKIHEPAESAFNWIPVAFGVLNVLALPFLFSFRKTVAWAYLLNFATVVVGTAAMAYYSITNWKIPLTFVNLALNSTFADIVILLAKLPLAHMVLRHFRPKASS